jgi:hypothetical protein
MHAADSLCYLNAANVQSPAGELADVDLRSPDDEPLGTVEGVLIDPAERRVRYFVVESPGWLRRRHYLLPADAPARVEADRKTLRLDVKPDELARCPEFDSKSVRQFSEDDAITAMFARRVA